MLFMPYLMVSVQGRMASPLSFSLLFGMRVGLRSHRISRTCGTPSSKASSLTEGLIYLIPKSGDKTLIG